MFRLSVLSIGLLLASTAGAQVTEPELPKFWQEEFSRGEKPSYPGLHLSSYSKVGHVGMIDNRNYDGTTSMVFRLVRKLPDGTGLMKADAIINNRVRISSTGLGMRTQTTYETRGPFIIKGLPLGEMASDAVLPLNGMFKVTGTAKAAEFPGLPEEEMLVIERAELPPLPPDNIYPEWFNLVPRTWKDTTGKFSKEGLYAGYDSGTVRIKVTDGVTLDVPMTKLDTESQSYVRAQIKAALDYQKELRKPKKRR